MKSVNKRCNYDLRKFSLAPIIANMEQLANSGHNWRVDKFWLHQDTVWLKGELTGIGSRSDINADDIVHVMLAHICTA